MAYGAIRRSLAYSAGHGIDESLDVERQMMELTGCTEDHRNAVAAFLARQRPPSRAADVTAAQNIATIERLYAAMDAARRRGDGGLLRTRSATFTDPVFVGLSDGEPQDMWRMLVGRSRDMTVELVEQGADGEELGHRPLDRRGTPSARPAARSSTTSGRSSGSTRPG